MNPRVGAHCGPHCTPSPGIQGSAVPGQYQETDAELHPGAVESQKTNAPAVSRVCDLLIVVPPPEHLTPPAPSPTNRVQKWERSFEKQASVENPDMSKTFPGNRN